MRIKNQNIRKKSFCLLLSEFALVQFTNALLNSWWSLKQVIAMKIGILGSGVVGKALAKGFLDRGDEVMIGTRDPSKMDDWIQQAGQSSFVGNFQETADFGNLLILAVRGNVADKVLEALSVDSYAGKTIVDATNPIAEEMPKDGILQFFSSINESLMEVLQSKYSQANFVKAFNSVGSAHMVHPEFEVKPTMFICGNNEEAKQAVTEILDDFGWEVDDMGVAEAARAIEPLCMLYCIPGFREHRWNQAFKLLKK